VFGLAPQKRGTANHVVSPRIESVRKRRETRTVPVSGVRSLPKIFGDPEKPKTADSRAGLAPFIAVMRLSHEFHDQSRYCHKETLFFAVSCNPLTPLEVS